MTGIVLDASVALAWYFRDEVNAYADSVARSIPALEIFVPTIWHLEIANSVLVSERRQRGTRATAARWFTFIHSLPLTIDDQTSRAAFGEILELARDHGLSVYDASYIELALRRSATLATLDAHLSKTAKKLGIRLYAPS